MQVSWQRIPDPDDWSHIARDILALARMKSQGNTSQLVQTLAFCLPGNNCYCQTATPTLCSPPHLLRESYINLEVSIFIPKVPQKLSQQESTTA